MLEAATMVALIVCTVVCVWAVVHVRRARREAMHASEVAVSSLLFAVAAATEASNARRKLRELSERAIAIEADVRQSNVDEHGRTGRLSDRGAILAGDAYRLRCAIDEEIASWDSSL